MDIFLEQSTENYSKEPKIESLVKEFHRTYRTVAEDRYEQLLGQIRRSQPPLNIPSKIGFSCSESLPESPVSFNSQNSVRRKLFWSPMIRRFSREQVSVCQESSAGAEILPFPSTSKSDSGSKSLKKQMDKELKILQEENEQLSRDLNNSRSEQKALQKHLDKLQDEFKALQKHNGMLHLEASSVQLEKSALVDEVERLMKANLALASFGDQAVKNLKEELYICQRAKGKLLSGLREIGRTEEIFKDKLKSKFQQLTQELMSYAPWEDPRNEGISQHEQKSKLHSEAFNVLPHDTRETSEKVSSLHLHNFENREKNSEKFELIEKRSPNLQHIDHAFTSQEDDRQPKFSKALLGVSATVQCLKQKLKDAQEALESADRERYKMDELVGEMKRRLSGSQCNFISTQNWHDEKAKEKQLLEAYFRAVFASIEGEKAVKVLQHSDNMYSELQQKILTQVEHKSHEEQASEVGSKGMGRLYEEIPGQKESINSPRRKQLSNRGAEMLAFKKQLDNNHKGLRTFQSDVCKLQASLSESTDQNNSLEEQMRKLQQVFEVSGWAMIKLRDVPNNKHTNVKSQMREVPITEDLEVYIWNKRSTDQDERKIIEELQNFVMCFHIGNLAFKSVPKRCLQTFCRQNEEVNQATDLSDRDRGNLYKDAVVDMGDIFNATNEIDLYLPEIASLRKQLMERMKGSDQLLLLNLEEHEDGKVKAQKVDTKLITESEMERAQALAAHKHKANLWDRGSPKFQEEDAALTEQERKLEFYLDTLQEENRSVGKGSKELQEKEALHTGRTLQHFCVQKTDNEMDLLFENSLQETAKSQLEFELCSSRKKTKCPKDSESLDRYRFHDSIKRLTDKKKTAGLNVENLEMELANSWNSSNSMEETLQSHSKDSEFFEKYEMVRTLEGELRKFLLELAGSKVVKATDLQQTETEKLRRQISLLEAQVVAEQGSIIMLEKHIAALQQKNSQLRKVWNSGTAEMEVLREEQEKVLKLQSDSDPLKFTEQGCKVHNPDHQNSRKVYQGNILHVESQPPPTIAIGKLEGDKEAFQVQVVLNGRSEQILAELPTAEDSEQRWRHPSLEPTANIIEEAIQRPEAALSYAQEKYVQAIEQLEAELKLIKPVAFDGAEVWQDKIIPFEQYEADHVQCTTKNFKDLKGDLKNLKELLDSMLKLNMLFSTMAFQQDRDSDNVVLFHPEALMLCGKIAKLSELSHTSWEKVKVIEDTFHKLRVINLITRDELSASARKEKALRFTIQFMRAVFFCLGQRIKALKEEKEAQAQHAELTMEAERKKSGEVISKLRHEVNFQEEQNRRKSELIIERCEEKREAIRQLSLALNCMREDNRHLKGIIKSMKCEICRKQLAFAN